MAEDLMAALSRISGAHQPCECDPAAPDCAECDGMWPCDTARLAAALRAVMEEAVGIEALAAEHERLDFDPVQHAMAAAYQLCARSLRPVAMMAWEAESIDV